MNDHGQQFTLTNDDAVVFVDETGHDRFHDPNHPVFGWAGCAMTVPVYARVADAWRTLKAEHFPNVAVMHAAERPLSFMRIINGVRSPLLTPDVP